LALDQERGALRQQRHEIRYQGRECYAHAPRRQRNLLDTMISPTAYEIEMQVRRGGVIAFPLLVTAMSLRFRTCTPHPSTARALPYPQRGRSAGTRT
jgi:hypothetical protein